MLLSSAPPESSCCHQIATAVPVAEIFAITLRLAKKTRFGGVLSHKKEEPALPVPLCGSDRTLVNEIVNMQSVASYPNRLHGYFEIWLVQTCELLHINVMSRTEKRRRYL